MKTLSFSIEIDAPKEKVWNILWDDSTYRKWANVFYEGSYAVSDWDQGSKVLFLGPSGDGMFSVIDKKVLNREMSFKHLGVVKDGEEQPETEESKKWAGATENYKLEGENGNTELEVTIEVVESHEQYFKDTFPKALEAVKNLAEN